MPCVQNINSVRDGLNAHTGVIWLRRQDLNLGYYVLVATGNTDRWWEYPSTGYRFAPQYHTSQYLNMLENWRASEWFPNMDALLASMRDRGVDWEPR